MQYDAILFDLDGTLLPMDTEEFTTGYFRFLSEALAAYNIDPKSLTELIWKGVGAMVKNTGEATNEEVFWKVFFDKYDLRDTDIKAKCIEFYGNDFHKAKIFTKENPLAKRAVELSRQKADKVILATNPLFPMVGQRTRLSWIGLKPEDFDLVTSYESDYFCKPNPQYFASIIDRMNLSGKSCLHIGNDEYEDGYSASKVGMNCYLVTDCMIKSKEYPWEGQKGSFEELIKMLEEL